MERAVVTRIYRVVRPGWPSEYSGGTSDGRKEITGVFMDTYHPADLTRCFRCQTWPAPGGGVDTASCLALSPDAPGRSELHTIVTDLLGDIEMARPEHRSWEVLTAEADRILDERDYRPFAVSIEGAEVVGVRIDRDGHRLSLVVHGGHLIAVEARASLGDFAALEFDLGTESVRASLLS